MGRAGFYRANAGTFNIEELFVSNTNTGGPAFPQNTKLVHAAGQEVHQGFMGGMTLRDYFAAKAMQGILAKWGTGLPPSDMTVEASYAYADAMLKAREA